MPDEHAKRPRGPLWLGLGVLVVAALLGFTHPGRAATRGFLASLRIERPKRVTATYTAPAGSRYSRRMQDMVAHMVAGAVHVTEDEPARTVKSVQEATDSAGFAPLVAPAGHGSPTLTVTGARTVTLQVQRAQLATILHEAGVSATLPGSLDGASLTLKTPRGIEAQYGDCPAPTDTTLQSQLVGRPRTTAANRSCIVLSQQPEVSAALPSGLDVDQLLDIALEVSGESPDEVRAMRAVFDQRAALSLDLPRFVRSHDFVTVRGVHGVLMKQGWRRGPAYTLVWADQGRIYEMSGYGASSGAVPLADSLVAAPTS